MRPSRGMGAIAPSKMGKPKTKARRDNTDFTEYKEGGKVKKFEGGGKVIKDSSLSSDDAQATALRVYNGRPNWGAKTNIGASAAQKSFDKNWADPKVSTKEVSDKAIFARDEADEEVQRERTRGIQKKAKGGEVWDKARPKDLGKPKKMSSAKKASAKAAAKAAGRPYPNLIDNMRAARKK